MVVVELELTDVTPRRFWDECAKAMAAEGLDMIEAIGSFEEWKYAEEFEGIFDGGHYREGPYLINNYGVPDEGCPGWITSMEFSFGTGRRGYGYFFFAGADGTEGVA